MEKSRNFVSPEKWEPRCVSTCVSVDGLHHLRLLSIFSRACSSRVTYLLSTVSVGVFVCMSVCLYVCGQLEFNFKY